MISQIKTPQEQWQEFKETVYPDGMTPDQNRQLHMAFFAGMLVACNSHEKISELPEEQAMAELGKYRSEVRSVNQATADRARAIMNRDN